MREIHNLQNVSIQQLLVLEALISERSATRAANKLGVTQSAVSHALRGLRETLNDELFVRVGNALEPTARTEELTQSLRSSLNSLAAALEAPGEFDPAAARREFRISMGDSSALSLLPSIQAIMREEAPDCDLDIRPPPNNRVDRVLESGDADLAIAVDVAESPILRTAVLHGMDICCAVRADHPDVGDTIDIDTFCRLPHALMSPTGEGKGFVDTYLERMGRKRRVQLRIRFFSIAPIVVSESDLVLSGPRDVLEQMASLVPLKILEPPFPETRFKVQMYWAATRQNDPANRWLRGVLRRVAATK